MQCLLPILGGQASICLWGQHPTIFLVYLPPPTNATCFPYEDIPWNYMVYYTIAWHFVVLHSLPWYAMTVHGKL